MESRTEPTAGDNTEVAHRGIATLGLPAAEPSTRFSSTGLQVLGKSHIRLDSEPEELSMNSPSRKVRYRLMGCNPRRCPSALPLVLGALALACSLGWAGTSLAQCPPPTIDGNIDDL